MFRIVNCRRRILRPGIFRGRERCGGTAEGRRGNRSPGDRASLGVGLGAGGAGAAIDYVPRAAFDGVAVSDGLPAGVSHRELSAADIAAGYFPWS